MLESLSAKLFGSLFLTFCHVESLFVPFLDTVSFECIPGFIQKDKRGESERWRRSSAGCERVQALAGGPRAVAPRLLPCSSFLV